MIKGCVLFAVRVAVGQFSVVFIAGDVTKLGIGSRFRHFPQRSIDNVYLARGNI